uniref:Helicase HerA central domain-containing protein n=1 Tax=Aliivibrio wodanis TaxID=80852 RepID=A0A5Q4ZVZ3_9GAMM|nr:hypothetical protein AW0309160_03817 [Aliivibrio wodanis]
MINRLTTATSNRIATDVIDSLDATQELINKSYLASLEKLSLMPLSNTPVITPSGDLRIFRIELLVQENKQSVLESTTAAYTALGAAGYSVFLYLKSDGVETDLFIGTRGEPGKMLGHNSGELLKETFKGHFPGSQLSSLKGNEVNELLKGLDNKKDDSATTITSVSSVPSLSTDDQQHFMQGLEKFIDAAENRSYQAIILAESISASSLDNIRKGYEQVSTQLSSLVKRQYSYGIQDSDNVSQSISQSLSHSLGESLGLTESQALTEGTSDTTGSSVSDSKGTSSPDKIGKIIGMGAVALGSVLGGPLGAVVGGSIGGLFASQNTESTANTSNESHTDTKSETQTTSQSKTTTDTKTEGTTDSQSIGRTVGNSQQISYEIVDKTVEGLLHKIDRHINRVNEAKNYGGWQTAAYFIGEGKASSEALASIFLGLMRGQNSSSEDFSLTSWQGNSKNQVIDWLTQVTHPRIQPDFSDDIKIGYLTPATLVSGKEMAIQLSLPRRSTSTVMVQQARSFGRKVQILDPVDMENQREIDLGNVRHLWSDLNQKVKLNVDDLSSHLFVTGSTGSGKSNTVYSILESLKYHNVPFLVIEPAKGEYKHLFGHRDDVRVLGTNAKKMELLKINPFSFPDDIHVLEHADRLVEVFNVCWSMYAAMPAILKEAILQSYEACGWDLTESVNCHNQPYFPTFKDLLKELDVVIESSDYSQEMKSNYSGALITRVRSLVNGLNGQIFTDNEISNTELFDSNVIVDLSRVGAQETKSLIMGLLIIKLSEYRSQQALMNQPLQHVTVLEEAHNILASTSSSSVEGSAIAEKSVEMLSNAIAEMRTFGEGFIIADQSPSSVHSSAIRNTNTKIVMRLPDESDRNLVGKSVALSNEQIDELAKLPKGVAVVYQSNWLEAVLCKINKFTGKEILYKKVECIGEAWNEKNYKSSLLAWLLTERTSIKSTVDSQHLKTKLYKANLLTPVKILLNAELSLTDAKRTLNKKENFCHLAAVVFNILNCDAELNKLIKYSPADYQILTTELTALIESKIGSIHSNINLSIQEAVMKALSTRSTSHLKLYVAWKQYMKLKVNNDGL